MALPISHVWRYRIYLDASGANANPENPESSK